MDDAGLLERARRGDEAAFSQLFARHERAIYRYAVYMCGPEAGDDIVQETFLAVLRQTARDDALRGSVAGYLLGIARHLAIKRLGSRGQDETLSDDLPSGSPAVLDDLARAEAIDAVRAAVRSLPPEYREVVVLCSACRRTTRSPTRRRPFLRRRGGESPVVSGFSRTMYRSVRL